MNITCQHIHGAWQCAMLAHPESPDQHYYIYVDASQEAS